MHVGAVLWRDDLSLVPEDPEFRGSELLENLLLDTESLFLVIPYEHAFRPIDSECYVPVRQDENFPGLVECRPAIMQTGERLSDIRLGEVGDGMSASLAFRICGVDLDHLRDCERLQALANEFVKFHLSSSDFSVHPGYY